MAKTVHLKRTVLELLSESEGVGTDGPGDQGCDDGFGTPSGQYSCALG